MTDLMPEVALRMEMARKRRAILDRARAGYDRFRVRLPWRLLPGDLRGFAFRKLAREGRRAVRDLNAMDEHRG